MPEKEFDDIEYVMAVCRAMDMPEGGLTGLTVEWRYPGPVIVRFEYLRGGKPELMEVMPKVEHP